MVDTAPEVVESVAGKNLGNETQTPPEAVRVLTVSFILFTLFFAVWVMFGIIGLKMRKELGMSEGEFALLAAIPVLTGSVLRVPVGIITDRIGGRNMMIALLLITALPTYLVSRIQTYEQALILAFFIGMAGTSFAAGVAWVSAWYPPERKGFALGIFGLGNVGAALTGLLAPVLLTLVATGGILGGWIGGGWRFIPTMYAILLVLSAAIIPLLAPKPDRRPAEGRGLVEMLSPLKIARVWRFGFYYFTVFGGYVALTLWLPKYYVDVYGYELRSAGLMTALFIFPASLTRPIGGYVSDRAGARPVIAVALVVMALALVLLSTGLAITPFVIVVMVMAVAMGVGMASVYTYIPRYFGNDVGAVGGLVGALGALGGFVLPLVFAYVKRDTGSPESTWLVLLALVVLSMIMLAVAVMRLRAGAFRDEVDKG
jgi:NNP family nitrate/nitrite transporter-like MFS transporter